MNKIKVEDTLKKHNIVGMTDLIMPAIKEILELAIDKCAEEALIIRNPTGDGEKTEIEIKQEHTADIGYEEYIPVYYTVHKQSILNVKNLIDYE